MADMIIMRLAGPIQSWGEYVVNDVRETKSAPTKSGVIGLIACAMGLRRGDPKIPEMCQTVKMACRTDRTGKKRVDFHTVQDTLQADGKVRKNAVVARQEYIEDGCFTVFLTADKEWLDAIEKALRDPVWAVYLGRACCVPSEPVFLERTDAYGTFLEAIRQYPLAKRHSGVIHYETDCGDQNRGSRIQYDVVAEGKRNFRSRTVWSGTIEGENK